MPALSWETLQRNKRKELERLSDLYRKNLEEGGVAFIEGRGRVVDPNTVEVNGKRYRVSISLIAPPQSTFVHACHSPLL